MKICDKTSVSSRLVRLARGTALPCGRAGHRRTAFEDTVVGRRVVISSDGGRIRLRETKRGPKTKKGRRRYTGAWCEPKVLIVYVVDAEGQQESRFAPFIDATLKGPDAVFALLRTYLQRLEITQADHVLFIADGAPWIWKRVPLLVQALGLATAQVHELLDFYHAVQHLGEVAALRKDWSAKARTRWRTQQRHLLMRSEVEQVIWSLPRSGDTSRWSPCTLSWCL